MDRWREEPPSPRLNPEAPVADVLTFASESRHATLQVLLHVLVAVPCLFALDLQYRSLSRKGQLEPSSCG